MIELVMEIGRKLTLLVLICVSLDEIQSRVAVVVVYGHIKKMFVSNR